MSEEQPPATFRIRIANMSADVSVVIPNYNHTRYLAAAIDSVLNQTQPPLEVIVVDDGSTDDCREVVSAYGARVRYCFQRNQGLAGARNTGIRMARGEFVGLLDADDQWLPEFLESFQRRASASPAAAVYYCRARAVDEEGRPLPGVFGGPPGEPAAMRQRLLRANFLIPSTVVMRRQAVIAAGLFDASLRSCEDWDLWLRLLPAHEFVGDPACLVLYRRHTASLSANRAGMKAAALAVMTKHFGEDDGRWSEWPGEKRRAYGGVYSLMALVSIQRNGDWAAAESHLRHALQVDPTIACCLDFFYAIAHGRQTAALRGTATLSGLAENATAIEALLGRAFTSPAMPAMRGAALATAFHALGLVAYNTGHYALSRRYLLRAATHRPALLRDRTVVSGLAKSFVAPLLRRRTRGGDASARA